MLQGAIIPGPADVVYAPLAAAHPARARSLALLAALGSVIGGVIAYWIGTQLGAATGSGQLSQLLSSAGVTMETVRPWEGRLTRWGWALVLLATVSPLSTKLVCIAAGAVGVSPVPFLAALAAGRTARTVTVAWLAGRAVDLLARRAATTRAAPVD